MKAIYNNPEIQISKFNLENIITTSGVTAKDVLLDNTALSGAEVMDTTWVDMEPVIIL